MRANALPSTLPPDARAVLDFWFDPPDDPQHGQPRAEWFRKDAAFDAQIRERFGALIESALAGQLSGWAASAQGALAQLIVLDQFTRNSFRDTARAFAGDARALAAARAMVASGQDRQLGGVQRQFVYLPFEHAEDLAAQQQSLQLFGQLEQDEPTLAGLQDWAHKHQVIVARFGRFPHRNAALGRPSTAEELAFLQTPGSGF
ncbi:DUF924 family protein [Aquabacterium sp.]|uniref:DUF924 family protein n=1 Tax=Aquabacterium sp. TaxID=1872578 RepID=UPI002D054707|nr:DUF924 family protein [Aquabacterium sp.]HSW09034.1 DUF924 family protein [Aquabacterium sp.]